MELFKHTCSSHFKVIAKTKTENTKQSSLKRKRQDDITDDSSSLNVSVPVNMKSALTGQHQSYSGNGYIPGTVCDSENPLLLKDYCSYQGIFSYIPCPTEVAVSIAGRYLSVEKRLCEALLSVSLPPIVKCVYNSLEYAFKTHFDFVLKYGNAEKKILFVGMNPGPFGMSQNGVPFGETKVVREWMRIQGEVNRPAMEHPKRPIHGLDCKRSEVSGARFWGLFQKLCGNPEVFFRNCFVYNVCPLAFVAESGKNITPPELPAMTQRQINVVCEAALLEVMKLLNVQIVVGVGKFAYECVQKLLRLSGLDGVTSAYLMHPSPGNPAANRGWETIAMQQLSNTGVLTAMEVEQARMDSVTCGQQQWIPVGRPRTVSHTIELLNTGYQPASAYGSAKASSQMGCLSSPQQQLVNEGRLSARINIPSRGDHQEQSRSCTLAAIGDMLSQVNPLAAELYRTDGIAQSVGLARVESLLSSFVPLGSQPVGVGSQKMGTSYSNSRGEQKQPFGPGVVSHLLDNRKLKLPSSSLESYSLMQSVSNIYPSYPLITSPSASDLPTHRFDFGNTADREQSLRSPEASWHALHSGSSSPMPQSDG